MRWTTPLVGAMLLVACGGSPQLPDDVETTSLLGAPLVRPTLPPDIAVRYDSLLAIARADHQATPDDPDAVIWLGRRTAYLGRYREAVVIYTEGIEHHGNDPRLYRHRGHRYVTLRQFDRAVADFERAAELFAGTPDEVEPDGIPNAKNIPTSTLQFNVWYHLGLAHYLKGDFQAARRAYERCLEVSTNPDALVATTHWYYMTLRRLGHEGRAAALLQPIHGRMEIIENDSYHQLLLMYKGQIPADALFRLSPDTSATLESATIGYGVGNWHLYNGRRETADQIFEAIVRGRDQWAAFGYIAAEAELARRQRS